ncbi:hypothetical protein [Peribacillus sp. RS7]|uniref:hypothetical protein n=1 Tax=Peribacillus sp. RS7 TaxID=3242679 RepID=UPI0035BFAA4E
MFDFKYRPARAIWDSAKINTSDKTDTMKHLLAYRNDFVSPFIYNKILPRYWKRVRPVQKCGLFIQGMVEILLPQGIHMSISKQG